MGHLAFRNFTQTGVGAVLRRKANAGPLRVPAAPIDRYDRAQAHADQNVGHNKKPASRFHKWSRTRRPGALRLGAVSMQPGVYPVKRLSLDLRIAPYSGTRTVFRHDAPSATPAPVREGR